MTKKISVVSEFGTLDDEQLKILRDGIKEMSVVMSKIDIHKESLKDIVVSVYEEIKIPKKIINRIAKVYHKNSFAEVIVEDKEFETLYSTVVEKSID